MTVQRYLQIQQGQQNGISNSSNGQQQSSHRKLDRSLSEPKSPKGQSQSTNSSRYKTELCRPFEESGVCKYGDKCQFAHGFQELRTLTRHPKYKTELCCTFHTTGLCPYGSRCHFIHNPEENRAKIMPSLPIPQPMNHHNHQNTLRSLSIGSSASVGSSSSTGELSPSSSPGMFDDPFAPGVAAAAAAAGVALPHAFSAFGSDFEMTALAAAFSAAENKHRGLNLKSVASAPVTPPFGSQLNLLSVSSTSSSSSCGPWGSPTSSCSSSSSASSSSSSTSSSQDMFQFPAGELHCSQVQNNPGQLYADSAATQSSPVDSLSFELGAIALGTPRTRANANSPTQTRLPIFNQLAHSD
ncbi:mRNA decay activator protein ZFP36L1-like [Galendromus occidentalis]|uniref:mRNA decay activator protein ZFP36L1-like n=1 Tax=Galendromus occidentalis TaxID=34638 RepID=A0AAJ7WIX7_9ACAR|nr:mRNA decay activator protein ZFP36L1-like [Galendromus occidentalis]